MTGRLLCLVGGPPRVGKSSLALEMLTRDGLAWLPTDVLRTVLRRVLRELDDVDHDPVDPAQLAELMYPHLEQAAEVCVEESPRFLIEGFEISPLHTGRFRTALSGVEIRTCFIGNAGFSSDDLGSYRGPKPQGETMMSRAELDEAAAWIRRHSEQLREQCDRTGQLYLDVGDLGFKVALKVAREHLLGRS